MNELHFSDLHAVIPKRLRPFFEELLKGCHDSIDSLYVVGSAATPDFHEKHSNINSIVVLNEFDFEFMRFLGRLGKTHKKQGIAAPLIMTPLSINRSLDVFPVEFLDIRLIHKTVYGKDIFSAVEIDPACLRIQCEREIKTRLIGLRQGYIASHGDKDLLADLLARSITGCLPVLRGIVFLAGKEPPIGRGDTVRMLATVTEGYCRKSGICIRTEVLEKVLALKHRQVSLPLDELHRITEEYYNVLEITGRFIDEFNTADP
jgi:hypothetical protein